jgi:acylaminoacyl-peptidase
MVSCDPNGAFGIPSWNVDETCIVYIAEQTIPSIPSFFDATSTTVRRTNLNSTTTTSLIGQQQVMGIGQMEHYGEKYRHHILYHSIFCVNIHTGQVGMVSNVPSNAHRSLSTMPTTPITLGQVQFCPPYYNTNHDGHDPNKIPTDQVQVEESIVYTGWGIDISQSHRDADTNATMTTTTTNTYTKRLGLIYCQQRPCQLYHSKVTHLLHQLSRMDNDDNDTINTAIVDPPCVILTPDMKLAHSPRWYYYTPPILNRNQYRNDTDHESPRHHLNHPTATTTTTTKQNLVFLTSRYGFDTHSGCWAIGKIHLSQIFDLYQKLNTSPTTIVVEEVWAPTTASKNRSSTSSSDINTFVTGHPHRSNTVAGLSFPGFFLQQLPQTCFLSSEYILVTTQWGSCQKVVRVSILDGTVNLISIPNVHPYSSDELLLCNHVGAIIGTKTPHQPAVVHFIDADQLLPPNFPTTIDENDNEQAQPLSNTIIGTFAYMASWKITLSTSRIRNHLLPVLSNSFDFDIRVVPVNTTVDGVDCLHQIESILLLPTTVATAHDQKSNDTISSAVSSPNELPPLIVIPHGGPHSASITNFVVSYAYLCGYGRYAILLVNYRGSTGYGQASIRSLPTNIGTQDVQDVIIATNDVCNSGLVDANRIGICGGSHGGFLTAHLTGQYPNMFKAAVMRNPVVNLPSMVTSTDIPDWCYVEACGTYNFDTYRPPTLEELQTFYKVSPIQYVQKVETPTLIALGLKDLRVPPSQGMEWYYSLRGRSVPPPPPTKLLLYENDDHAIDGVASEADHWVHIKQWFDQYLR